MEALIRGIPVDLWWYFYTPSGPSSTVTTALDEENRSDSIMNRIKMMVVVGVLCLTLLFVMTRADAWLSNNNLLRRTITGIRRTNEKTTEDGPTSPSDGESQEGEKLAAEAESRLLSRFPWWEDSWVEAILNSFSSSSSGNTLSADSNATDELSQYDEYAELKNAQVLHFCFLLHGHRGYSTDLSFLQRVMQHHAETEKRRLYNDTPIDDTLKHDMIVHCATCNEHKTTDGVVNGGERLVQEMLQIIRRELEKRGLDTPGADGVQDITISIVGNSLGGLYGRYAIAKLAEEAARNESKTLKEATMCGDRCILLDDKYRMHFNIFCTTATPHLGVAKHTYVPLPRSAEFGVARALGDTGRDLFRLNNLLKNMATCPRFLNPLRNFRKRIAYANAYATDFPVPATTAAFLSDESTYPHEFVEEVKTDPSSKQDYVVAILRTPQGKPPADQKPREDSMETSEEHAIADDLVLMSKSLDSLGWKKVFVDLRKEIPLRVALPRSFNIRGKLSNSSLISAAKTRLRRDSDQSSSTSEDASTTSSSTDDDGAANLNSSSDQLSSQTAEQATANLAAANDRTESVLNKLRQKGIVQSRDIASAVSTPEDNRLSLPIGHNLMVAMSREGKLTSTINKGGRPVMDALAKELVEDIFNWSFEEENEEAGRTLAERDAKKEEQTVTRAPS